MKPRPRNRYRNSLGLSTITAILIVVASLALVGLAQRMLDMSVDYVAQRKQRCGC